MPNDDNDNPWGGGNNSGNKSPWGGNSGNNGSGPGQGDTGIPEIDQIVKKGQERLKVLMGGRGGSSGGSGPGRVGPPNFGRNTISLILLGIAVSYTHLTLPTNREV